VEVAKAPKGETNKTGAAKIQIAIVAMAQIQAIKANRLVIFYSLYMLRVKLT